jgi:hypothetical protein
MSIEKRFYFDSCLDSSLPLSVIPRGDLDNVVLCFRSGENLPFITSFAIEDVPLVFPRAKKMWDLSGGLPSVIPPGFVSLR